MKETTVDVFDNWLDNRLEALHTIMPGKIISYTGHGERKAEVQPLVQLKTARGASLEIPPIKNVPVIFPSSGTTSILFELKKGDGVLLLFSEASIGNYLNSNNENTVEPEDSSRFSLTDCIAIPGLWSFPRAPQTNAAEDSLHLEKEESYIEIKKDSINIEGTAVNVNGDSKAFVTHAELTSAINTFISVLNTHTHISAAPGSPTAPPVPTMSLDISSAATTTVKTGG